MSSFHVYAFTLLILNQFNTFTLYIVSLSVL